ncbi:MAG: Xaa-Pro peptidase family protein [Nanoarchaeota archaeon]|nr:Xaa-Pro peptidase family protein [Nanoarchaeota archaeon]
MFAARVAALRKSVDAGTILLSSPEDVFYYTGYQPTDDEQYFLVVSHGKPALFVSPLVGKVRAAVRVKPVGTLLKTLSEKTVAFDETTLRTSTFLLLKKKTKLVKAAGSIKKPREIKSAKEIELIRQTIRIAAKAYKKTRLSGTEAMIAQQFDQQVFRQGAVPAFQTIVAGGTNSGNFIHHTPGSYRPKKTDLVIFDFGAKVHGYCSDTTRMWCTKPGKRENQLLEDVSNIQQQIIDVLEIGKTFNDIQAFYEQLAKRKRYSVQHAFGHGIGLSVHESFTELKPGNVVTVEPGIYVKKFGGCRYEDMILMKNRGKEILTRKIPA